MKNFILISFLIFGKSFSQNYMITYSKSSNGKTIENQDVLMIFTNANHTLITTNNIISKKTEFPFEQNLVVKNSNEYIQIASLNDKKIIQTKDSISLNKQSFEYLPDTKKILGYVCKKAKTTINSNTIELWYTNDLKLNAAPTILGQNLGLVLEMTRNGNYSVIATKIEKTKSFPKLNLNRSESLDLVTYRDALLKSRFTTIKIFKDQIINFSEDSISNDTILRFANGTIALRKMKFPVIKKGSQIFADITEQSNGDAYDRTGSFFIIPTLTSISFLDGLKKGKAALPIYTNGNGKEYQGVVATQNYTPIVEMIRFFTPFGIKHYNSIQLKDKNWQDNVYYRQDISDLRNLLNNQEVYVGIFIGNYDKGGHKVSANITIHTEEELQSKETKILPLFCTNNVMEMAGQEYGTMFNVDKGLEVTFKLDQTLKNCKLRYIVTGHGGWENGDEFVPKKNSIYLDGKENFSFTPWRQDCGSYRLSNPASGNFSNGLSSSDYSRANWCPGTVTNPIYIDLGNLEVGTHTIQVKIPQGLPEGNSFSSWNVSGVLIGE
jgi:GLPGLI family protein